MSRCPPRTRYLVGAAIALGLSTTAAVTGAAAAGENPADAATLTASVTVNATAGFGTVPAHGIGLNTGVDDRDMNDAAIPALFKAAAHLGPSPAHRR